MRYIGNISHETIKSLKQNKKLSSIVSNYLIYENWDFHKTHCIKKCMKTSEDI